MASTSKTAAVKTANCSKGSNPNIIIWVPSEKDDFGIDMLTKLMEEINSDFESNSSSDDEEDTPKWINDSLLDIKEDGMKDRSDDDYDEKEPGIIDDGFDETIPWTHNFNSFTAKPIPFTATPGPKIASTDPYEIFTSVWDKDIINLICEETNRYARQVFKSQTGKMPEDHEAVKWTDLTPDEFLVFISLQVFVSLHKIRIHEVIFKGNKIAIPFFPEIMPLSRFQSLNRCLHFTNNIKLPTKNSKIAKIMPIINHCNAKFSSLYQPRQFIDIDDSFLMSKEGSAPAIRTQANNIGIRTYEVSEVFTGYLLKVLQYEGTDEEIDSKGKAEIVMELIGEYSNNGYRVVTDRYFSSVYLSRLLRSKGFDNIGEVRRKRQDLPKIIQELEEDDNNPDLYLYNKNKVRLVSRHCGDLSVVAWSEWDLTALSTYHTSELKPNKKGIRRPSLSLDYYKAKEKISSKDEDLTEYVILSNDNERWYIKLFKLLLNCSIRNSYIIYKCNMGNNTCMTQVHFRHKLANQVLNRHGVKEKIQKAWYEAKKQQEECKDDSDDNGSSSEWEDCDDLDDSNECSVM